MKHLLLIAMAFLCSLAQAKTNLSAIKSGWTSKSISGVKAADITSLVTAFNGAWQTAEVSSLLDAKTLSPAQLKKDEDNGLSRILDAKNGYAFYNLDSPESDGISVSACVWRRSNGHRLFAIAFRDPDYEAPLSFCAFYDYDAASESLSPEKSLAGLFSASPLAQAFYFELPRHGKNLIVHELLRGCYVYMDHVFSWDGMKPVFSHVFIEDLATDLVRSGKLSGFPSDLPLELSLIDIDGDKCPEFAVRTADKSFLNVYTAGLTATRAYFSLIGFSTNQSQFDRDIAFYHGAVCSFGGIEGEGVEHDYFFLHDSRTTDRIVAVSLYDFDNSRLLPEKFSRFGSDFSDKFESDIAEPVSDSDAKAAISKLGKPFTPSFHWLKLSLK